MIPAGQMWEYPVRKDLENQSLGTFAKPSNLPFASHSSPCASHRQHHLPNPACTCFARRRCRVPAIIEQWVIASFFRLFGHTHAIIVRNKSFIKNKNDIKNLPNKGGASIFI
jgi:hypothetical protein